ncbi:MAG TPA: ACP S-malonyltransferase [Gammaproteobacteria bacterium]|nr:ACP S-malonyltransferase [Gammaproteobacteria bacterium]
MNTKLALVFPGQGSQSVGMLGDLATVYPLVQDTFAIASEVLGYDLWRLAQHGPEAELNLTHKTQPLMLAAGVALWRVWQYRSARLPNVMAGHSLGEYTALVCAGALDFADAVELVALRGQYMQEAVPADAGAMAAVLGLDNDKVSELCADAAQGEVVAAVNFNSPGQVVVAGHINAVTRVLERARETGAKRAVLLPVSVPSHCALMKPAAERLAHRLQQTPLKELRIAVLNNVDVAFYTDPASIRDGLARQLYNPVRWSEIIQRMAAQDIGTLIECGPGKVLAGLNKRNAATMKALSLCDVAGLEQALAA